MRRIPKHIYFLMFLLPSLAQYSILNGQLDFDVLAVLYIVAFLLLKNYPRHNPVMHNFVIIYLSYTVVLIAVNLLIGFKYATTMEILTRAGRYCLYFYLATLIIPSRMYYCDAMAAYRKIVYAASIYIVIQAVFYYGAGVQLPSIIGAAAGTVSDSIGRLRSFYSEPADMAYSILPFICCSLFGPAYSAKDKRLFDAAVASGAILISTSSQGTTLLLFLWGMWGLLNFGKKKSGLNTLMIMLVFPLAVIFLVQGTLGSYALGRLSGGTQSTAWLARNGGYIVYSSQNIIQKVFGNGYGNYFSKNIYGFNTWGLYIYFSALAGSLFMQGIIGTIILGVILWKRFLHGELVQRLLILTLVILSIGGDPMTGKYLFIYFPLIMCGVDKFIIDRGKYEDTVADVYPISL